MPRPRLDGTPAKAANRRTLSDAFLRAVKADPERVVMWWDDKLRGLVLAVQPSGRKSWKAVYSHGRPRWYHIGDAGAIGLADARKLASRIMFQVAEGKDPVADRIAERGHGTFAELAERYLNEYAKKHNKSWPRDARQLAPARQKISADEGVGLPPALAIVFLSTPVSLACCRSDFSGSAAMIFTNRRCFVFGSRWRRRIFALITNARASSSVPRSARPDPSP
jgi:Arm DNA-binding domain